MRKIVNRKIHRNNPRANHDSWILHVLHLIGFSVFFILLITFFHLMTMGLPKVAIKHITEKARESGIAIHIDSIRLSPLHGFVIKNFRLYSSSPDDVEPLLEAKKLFLVIWPNSFSPHSSGDWNISLKTKVSTVSLGQGWEQNITRGNIFSKAHAIKASLRFKDRHLVVKNAEIRWGNINSHTSGSVIFSGSPTFKLAIPLSVGTQTAKIANFLSQIRFKNDPTIESLFNVNRNDSTQNSVNIRGLAEGMILNGQIYNKIAETVSYTNNTISLTSFEIEQQSDQELSANGSFNVDNKLCSLNVSNTLNIDDLLSLFPANICENLAVHDIHHKNAFDVEATFGPSKPENLFTDFSACVNRFAVEYKDVTLDPLTFKILCDNGTLFLKDIKTTANLNSPLKGSAKIDLETGECDTKLTGKIFPNTLSKLADDYQKCLISKTTLPDQPLDVDIDISNVGMNEGIQINGTISATNLIFNSTPTGIVQTDIAYSNHTLTLNPLKIDNKDDYFDGMVKVDLNDETAYFDAITSFNPDKIIDILATNRSPSILQEFDFNGPVVVKGSGAIDYGTETNHNFKGTFFAKDVSAKEQLFIDQFESDVEGRGQDLFLTNAKAQLYKGTATGSAQFNMLAADGTLPYSVHIELSGIDYASVLEHATTNTPKRACGTLYDEIDISADASTDFWESVKGNGSIKIVDGYLGDIPVLSGLLRIVQAPILGVDFHFFSFDRFFADYEFKDGKLQSDNIKIGGTLISANAKGSYSPNIGLDFNVKVEPLSNSDETKKWWDIHLWGADALKIATRPFFILFDVSVTGDLKNPKWQLRHFSEELQNLKAEEPEKTKIDSSL